MKIRYLGTAAAEGWPALFCTCKACKLAREKGGRNIRTRSQSIIDDRLLIEFSADTYWHVITQRPVQKVTEATSRCAPDRIHTQVLERFKTAKIDGYDVTPMDADHDPYADSVIYIIERDGKAMLYAHDTGIFPETDWEYMTARGIRFDFVSLDCTGGLYAQYERGHMGTNACEKVKARMIAEGLADDKTVFCLNHFSHNGGAIYDEIAPAMGEKGFLVSFDGMEVEF